MKYLINFIIVFIIIYLFYFLFIINRKEEVKKFKNNTFVKYLVRIYKLDLKKLDMKYIANVVAISNSFIIATTYSIVLLIDGFVKQMFMAIGVFILLQLFIYHIIGINLKKKESKKN